ncbi:SpoVA/SpoVAEb family sporulation membrane protein, partial [Clostridioides difficile]|uniref:SpoVA/SpoVAEb family sporulation membrane protein n=1 Tax=Clostridioides difficile TaxID=1496 RepID=UPI001F169A43
MDKNYKKYVDQISPKPTYLKNYTLAFIVGGIICMIGQAINDLYMKVGGLDKLGASSATSITLIFIGAFLTGLGVYDLIGKRAGAGSIIPITGFANSIVSPAMEYKREGYVLGCLLYTYDDADEGLGREMVGGGDAEITRK